MMNFNLKLGHKLFVLLLKLIFLTLGVFIRHNQFPNFIINLSWQNVVFICIRRFYNNRLYATICYQGSTGYFRITNTFFSQKFPSGKLLREGEGTSKRQGLQILPPYLHTKLMSKLGMFKCGIVDIQEGIAMTLVSW